MNKQLSREELRKMPVEERLRLLEDVWATLCEAPDKVEAPQWQLDELDRRLAERKNGEQQDRPWPDVKTELQQSLRRR